ncbi:hypothetical protein ACLOJK_028880 [Asimina triloba]
MVLGESEARVEAPPGKVKNNFKDRDYTCLQCRYAFLTSYGVGIPIATKWILLRRIVADEEEKERAQEEGADMQSHLEAPLLAAVMSLEGASPANESSAPVEAIDTFRC